MRGSVWGTSGDWRDGGSPRVGVGTGEDPIGGRCPGPLPGAWRRTQKSYTINCGESLDLRKPVSSVAMKGRSTRGTLRIRPVTGSGTSWV